jgi:hypothetical protein
MNERLMHVCITLTDPDESAALGAGDSYFYAATEMKIVYVSAAPLEDDTGADIDINDDGSGVITAVDCSDADVPGTWKAEGYGGDEDPVTIAAGSKVSIDGNDFANGNAAYVHIWYLAGSIFS